MIRRIIQIDQEKCNGCSACAEACHEGAIAMADGKAKLAEGEAALEGAAGESLERHGPTSLS